MSTYLRVWFSIGIVSLLAACAGLPGGTADTAGLGAQTPQRQTAQPLHRQGRFAVHAERMHDKSEAVQGGFSWYDDGTQLVLELRNPLGQVMAQLQVNEQGAWLQEPRAGMRYSPSANALAEEIFNHPIPVEGLRTWLRGQVSADARERRFNAHQKITQAYDQGWRIELSDYDDLGPKRLLLVFHQGAQRITVRIVIDALPTQI